ncbi:MAG: hypothetical protein M3Q49_07420 [Actinomycetota bacterium]|nr:hypothetical protein [Actinomycetota bacterium]
MTGYVRTARMVLAMMLALSLMMVSAVAVAQKATAHQQPGRTLILVDGEVVKAAKDEHFTYRQRLAPGCHRVEVVRKQGGEVVSRSVVGRYCSEEPTRLIVRVDDERVTSTVRTIE